MYGNYKPMGGAPVSRIFVLEIAFILLIMTLSYYVFGFEYRVGEQGEPAVSFPGLIKSTQVQASSE